ncbi:hypothetical protein DBV15_11864 [Temnothorax longispinosus]|uniref:Phosphoribosylformylglycinamidine synthase n=1 Tax=Temnothorax longispinosus TaxID=300112 RepID=A0A4V3SBR7_9HYME|nr:hypothetical protein DBV15_11864 [Temnothorax longispinosus]
MNPNGSVKGIAAICSKNGRHLAMMPHPERKQTSAPELAQPVIAFSRHNCSRTGSACNSVQQTQLLSLSYQQCSLVYCLARNQRNGRIFKSKVELPKK